MRIQCATFNSHAFGVYFDSLHFDVILFHTDIGDENGIVKLPIAWGISQKTVQLGIEIILHQVTTLIEDDNTKNLVIKKYIVIEDWSGCMQYYVHGKNVNADQALLPNILNDVSALPAVLAKFERMRVCAGIRVGSSGTFLIKGEAFKDYSLSWHHNECSLITKKKVRKLQDIDKNAMATATSMCETRNGKNNFKSPRRSIKVKSIEGKAGQTTTDRKTSKTSYDSIVKCVARKTCRSCIYENGIF